MENQPFASRRVALIHDWLVDHRGGERVFDQICQAFPEADVYTLIYDPRRMPVTLRRRAVRSSFIQYLPFSVHYRRVCLPLYPLAARSCDLSSYDLVVASSSAWVHGVKVGDKTRLVCYCHSPFRYAWSHYDTLVRDRWPWAGVLTMKLRKWAQTRDLRAAQRVDKYLAASRAVQKRIAMYYGRESTIVPGPVDVDLYTPVSRAQGNYFLIVSALMKYKRVDIAVDACSRLGLPLKIVGEGEESRDLRRRAGPTVQFLGRRPDDEVARLYANCSAFLMTADEDFGITPLEAMAAGRPVVAFAAGGALDTIVEGVTGTFYPLQTSESLETRLKGIDFNSFDPRAIRAHAEQFGQKVFRQRLQEEVLLSTTSYGPRAYRDRATAGARQA